MQPSPPTLVPWIRPSALRERHHSSLLYRGQFPFENRDIAPQTFHLRDTLLEFGNALLLLVKILPLYGD